VSLDNCINSIRVLRKQWCKARRGRPRNRLSRPLTIYPRQIPINSIDLTDFILDSLYLPRLLADRTNGGAYAT